MTTTLDLHRIHNVRTLVDTLEQNTWAHTYWSTVLRTLNRKAQYSLPKHFHTRYFAKTPTQHKA
jgi:hypothetical protein